MACFVCASQPHRVEYSRYIERFHAYARLGAVDTIGAVRERGRVYPLLRFSLPGERWLTVTSGFHGEEQAGPLTLLERMDEIVAYASARRVGLRVYPCINPSGFESGSRYNASGERPNNDFLRYEVDRGRWTGELHPGQPFVRWSLHREGPKETRALLQDLERHPAPVAALDIHQDGYMRGRLVYAYTFGDRGAYAPMMRASSAHAEVASEKLIDDAGFRTDAQGFVEHFDGSVTDYFWRRGASYAATLETTVDNPIETCHAVNLIWIRGFIDLTHRALHGVAA